MANFDFQDFTKKFVVEEIKKTVTAKFPKADFNFENLELNMQFNTYLDSYVLYATQTFYSTTDSSRFETKEEKKVETSEIDVDMIPATIRDHVKHLILQFIIHKLRWKKKISWINPNYVVTKHIVTKNITITKHITTLEYTCPHMTLPGSHRNHVLHLAQGVPSLRAWVQDEKVRLY